jgi:predicted ATPase
MRLHQLRLLGFRGLEDVTIRFPDPALDYNGADIRFFVGRNGSGKSTALEALALIFSHLAAGAHPGFDFQLDYGLHGAEVRLTTLSSDGERQYTIEASRREPGEERHWPVALGSSNASLLPDRIIGYSTGPTSGMGDALFEAIQRLEEEIQVEEDDDDDDDAAEPSETVRRHRESFLSNPQTLFLDVATSTLPPLAALVSDHRERLLAHMLGPVDLDPVRPLLSFSLQIASEWDALLPEYEHRGFRELLELAAIVTRVEHTDDGGSHLVAAFDVGETLAGELSRLVGTPLTILETLVAWSRRSVLQRVRLVMRKRDVPEPITDADLSDGELFYMSRYALLLLASETRESLLLLDEPETHFNDNWKIELVEGVMRALGGDRTRRGDGHQVVIATHSSLTLTDAESALVQLFVRGKGGRVEVLDPPASTFGAAPGDLGQLLFGLDAPVGNFAERTLRAALERADAGELDRLASAMGPGYLRLAVQSLLEDVNDAPGEPPG